MKFELTILGTNSAVPAHGRHLSAQVLAIDNELFLIDCGEGTQMRMDGCNIKKHKINHIFISHLHGDHIFGLIGLIMTYGLSGRTTPLNIYSPEGLQSIIAIQLEGALNYPLHFHHTNPKESTLLFENNKIKVYTIPLVHRIPCHGFLFVEKERLPNIRKEKIHEYKIPYQEISKIKAGADFLAFDNKRIPHAELTIPPPLPRIFAYCSDTMYSEAIIPLIQGADLLYHEATFMHDLLVQAEKTMHSTARQAALIARKAGVKELLLGHFSSRYVDLMPLLEEARTVFSKTNIAIEGQTIKIKS